MREMGGSGMIIGDILCLLLLFPLPIFISPSSLSLLSNGVTPKYIKQAKGDGRDAEPHLENYEASATASAS